MDYQLGNSNAPTFVFDNENSNSPYMPTVRAWETPPSGEPAPTIITRTVDAPEPDPIRTVDPILIADTVIPAEKKGFSPLMLGVAAIAAFLTFKN